MASVTDSLCGKILFGLYRQSEMMCRDVLCQNFHQPKNGKCALTKFELQEHCSAIFIKMSVTTEASIQISDVLDQTYFERDLLKQFDTAIGLRNVTQEFHVFYQLDVSDTMKYVVLYVVFKFPDNYESYHVLSSLTQLPYLQIEYPERYVRFSLEFAVYNLTFSDQDAKIAVPNTFNTSEELDTKYKPFTNSNSSCSQNETVPINKLHFCPYIILHTDEIAAVVGQSLVFPRTAVDDNRPLKLLTKWEYERHGSNIHVCLKDYFDIYHAMPMHKEISSSDSDYPKLLANMYLISAYLLLI